MKQTKVLLQNPDMSTPEETSIIELLNVILSQQDRFMAQTERLQDQLNKHLNDETAAVQSLIRALPSKPDGTPDVDGHREYHASLIEEAKARMEFWRELRLELMRKGFWGLMGVLAFLVMYWWNKEVKR
jgi:hypothetical protein